VQGDSDEAIGRLYGGVALLCRLFGRSWFCDADRPVCDDIEHTIC